MERGGAKRSGSGTWSSSTTLTAEPDLPIGILGGTFDPVHLGHLAAAEQLQSLAGLREVWMLPNANPPHRPPPVASATDRLEMVRLAVACRPHLKVCDLEVKRGGVSYTLETLNSLAVQFPGQRFTWLVGYDAAVLIKDWYEPDAVLARATFTVFNRAGTREPDASRLQVLGFPPDRTRIVLINSPPITAHEIRTRLAVGLPVGDWLPPSVLDYIQRRRLYRSETQVP